MYRKHYLIGVYAPLSEGETLLALCNDIKEFAELMGIKRSNATRILHYLFTGQTNAIRFFGKLCSVSFIDEEGDDDEA